MKKTGNGVVMTCLRDGYEPAIQRTGQGGFFASHDLLHYAVETTLGFDRGFLGLMACGWSFDNFTRHDDPLYRPPPPEGLIVEQLVGVLSLHFSDPVSEDQELLELLTQDINRDLATVKADCGMALPILTVADVAAIRRTFMELTQRWAEVPLGDSLELNSLRYEKPKGPTVRNSCPQ